MLRLCTLICAIAETGTEREGLGFAFENFRFDEVKKFIVFEVLL